MSILFGIISVILGFVGYFFYIWGIIQGKVKPHAFTWFIWGIITIVAFLAQVVAGGGPGAWVTGFTAILCFVFAAAGLTRSSRIYISKKDWVIFASALAAVVLWVVTNNPLWSVILISIIDTVAFIPTFRKAYYYPETESAWAFSFSAIKFMFGIAALNSFTSVTVLFPAITVMTNAVFVAMLLWRKTKIK